MVEPVGCRAVPPPFLSEPVPFRSMDWYAVPNQPGVYIILDGDEVLYVGMAGRDGKGSLRRRLRDHASGQMVNMFALYLFLARVQFLSEERIRHPAAGKAAIRTYIVERCSFRYAVAEDGAAARELEAHLRRELRPALNPDA